MELEKYYTNKLISLPDLAKKVNTSPNNLSQVLNEKLNASFFEFVANHRIKEAQAILLNNNNSKLRIEEIAELVGYNSKSAFNTAFKKHTGKTPSDFRKHLSPLEV
jgi:YesN/AraC family two-component response regulator